MQQAADAFTVPTLTPWQRRILTTAIHYVGYPYVWGGTSPSAETQFGVPSVGGFDCSGFVWRVYKLTAYPDEGDLASVLRGRTTYQMSGEVPTSARITAADLQPADVMFFGEKGRSSTPDVVDHTAIYLGNGWFVQSSGEGVTLLPFAGYYTSYFAWGRRPLREAGSRRLTSGVDLVDELTRRERLADERPFLGRVGVARREEHAHPGPQVRARRSESSKASISGITTSAITRSRRSASRARPSAALGDSASITRSPQDSSAIRITSRAGDWSSTTRIVASRRGVPPANSGATPDTGAVVHLLVRRWKGRPHRRDVGIAEVAVRNAGPGEELAVRLQELIDPAVQRHRLLPARRAASTPFRISALGGSGVALRTTK